MKQIVVKIKKGLCSYCGVVTDVETREFSDCGSPISSEVCYSCQCATGLRCNPVCPDCGRKLYFVEKERFWGCPEHGRKEVKEFPDSRLFKYERVGQMSEIIEVDAECNITYSDGTTKACEHRPYYTFAECAPGYGGHGNCPKWDYYHKKGE